MPGTSGERSRHSSSSVSRTELGRLRFGQLVQRSRFATYVVAILVAFLFMQLGVLKMTLLSGAVISTAALGSAALFYAGYAVPVRAPLRRLIDPLSIASDVVMVSAVVWKSGGLASPWYIWYLAAAGGAVFITGRWGLTVISLVNTGTYLGLLALMGDVRAPDERFYVALSRMAFVHGAAYFFLRAAADLKEKRQLIKRLMENESRKVEELTRLTAALDQRGRELAEANVKIREADRMKSQFLANMSHELRTPLNSIIGFSDILVARLGEEVAPKYLKFLRNINASGQHLLGVINDILDLSKIEAGKMDIRPEPFAVGAATEGVCQMMKGVAAKREILFHVDVPPDLPLLEADPVRFKQVLYNLLSNAVKFSPDGSTVELRARHLSPADSPLLVESILVEVVDHGIGIDPKDHEIIFQEFRQADGSSTRKYEGTGLGLSLVRRFVELQDGTVRVKSAPGEGSTFCVTLPRAFQGARTPPETPAPPASADRRRVLVIEDEEESYVVIAHALASAGYIPLRARSGEEAIMLARALRPVAITLDLVLPGLDGWEVLKTLKADSVTTGIPVIIISLVDNRELGLALGADDYLLKPIERERLLARLADLIGNNGRTVLLVDDDPSVHDLLEHLLVPQGFQLEHALSGLEGLEKAARNRPALVVLDLMMDGMDGFEVATRLRSDPGTAGLPVLVLTAMDLSSRDRERLRGKIEALVQKGDGPSRLVAVIDDLVRRRAPEATVVRLDPA